MTLATQRTTAGVIEQTSNVPINRRVIFDSPTLVSPEKRTYPQKVAALTYGQVFGGIVGILSLGKMLIDFCFKRAGSFLDKCLIPILGTLTGIVLSLNSAKRESPELDITDNHPTVTGQNKNSTYDSGSDLLTSGQSVSPSIRPQISLHQGVAIGAGDTTNDPADELISEVHSEPMLRCMTCDDGSVTSDEILLDNVYEQLGFNFKKMPDDDKTLSLRYWFAMAYLKYNSKKDGDIYNRAIELIDEIILDNGKSEQVLEARENRSIRLTDAGIVLHPENLNLRTFRDIFGIAHDSPNSVVMRKKEKIHQLISLLTPSQKSRLETLFYTTYFPQRATVAK